VQLPRRPRVEARRRALSAPLLRLAVAACLAGQAAPASAAFFGDYYYGTGFWTPQPSPEEGWRPQQQPRPRVHRAKHPRDTGPEKPSELAVKARGSVLQIAISLRDQRLTLYANGTEIARSQISTGMPGHPTPRGLFNVIEKQRWHESNIYSGAPMPFMQRITWSGVALHLGVVPGYPASHGCIRMPDGFARQLWGVTKVGARVIISGEEVTPAPFEHARLFAVRHPSAPDTPPVGAIQPDTPQGAAASGPAPGAGASLRGPVIEQTGKTAAVQVAVAGAAVVMAAKAASRGDEPKAAERPLKPGPISVFISRKEGKLFVRKGFEPVLSAPVTIERPDEPLGTHLFTALTLNEDGATFRWDVVTVPNPPVMRPAGKSSRKQQAAAPIKPEAQPAPSAASALERITIPEETVQRISELMSPGASLIISDYGLGPETGEYTDFIVLTR
jgi:lipoprotein-anchoring transpeptidase ErfK/SrfK